MEWISVKDRLPDERTVVLVYVGEPSEEYQEAEFGDILTAYYIEQKGWTSSACVDDYYFCYPTHWKSLPEPPNLKSNSLDKK